MDGVLTVNGGHVTTGQLVYTVVSGSNPIFLNEDCSSGQKKSTANKFPQNKISSDQVTDSIVLDTEAMAPEVIIHEESGDSSNETSDINLYLNVDSGPSQQEVFLYDEESGEYHKYVCVQEEEQQDDGEFDSSSQIYVETESVESESRQKSTELESEILLVQESSGAITNHHAVSAGGKDFLAELVRSHLLDCEVRAEHEEALRFEVDSQGLDHSQPKKRKQNEKFDRPTVVPMTWVRCPKCQRTLKSTEFEQHQSEVHTEETGSDCADKSKKCSLCRKVFRRQDYLMHFKADHENVRLGCPKCPQTFLTPELLNSHYKNCHMKPEPKKVVEAIQNKIQSPANVSDNLHPSSSPLQVSKSSSRRANPRALHCDVCGKVYPSQREFTNHKRRKDFCKPPVEKLPEPKRRIGIIRRSL